ncbi:MAG: hypothetical protein HZB31_01510 [Nitrospirae bacterium]|nr:hypothetical protein [Nitrospirota bacterium]
MDEQTRFKLLYGGIYDVNITLTKCYSYGCLYFRVSVGNQSVDVKACNTTDYFPGFIRWIEAIAVGVEECAFVADEEGGIDKKFVYERGRDGIFIIMNYGDKDELLVAPVNTKQMVKAFYEGLRAFATSSIYDRRSWEGDRIADRLLDAKFLPDSAAEILDHMLTLSVQELKELIHKVAPICLPFPDPGPCNPPAEFHEVLFSNPDQDNPGKTIDYLGSFWYWDVPGEYDSWDVEAKRKYLIDTMNEKAPWEDEGTIFANIHSDIIEQWIDKEE